MWRCSAEVSLSKTEPLSAAELLFDYCRRKGGKLGKHISLRVSITYQSILLVYVHATLLIPLTAPSSVALGLSVS